MNKTIFTKLLLTAMLFFLAIPCENSFGVNETDERKTERVPVKVFTVIKRDLSSTLPTMGTVKYLAKADVSSEIDGVLSSVNVEEGDIVQKGQVIAVIDSTLLKAQLKQAQAISEMAEIDLLQSEYEIKKAQNKAEAAKVSVDKRRDYYETQKKLFEIGAINQSELDKAEVSYQKSLADYKNALEDCRSLQVKSKEGRIETEARLMKARADVEEIRVMLKKCTIKAPVSGVVSSKRKWAGERANPGDSVIVTLLETKEVYAEVDLNEKNIGLVKVGQQADVRADAHPDVSFMGKVQMISPTVDTNSRTVKVRVKVANDKQLLKPGMFVRSNIVLDNLKDVVAVPQDAVMSNKDGQHIIFVILEEVAFLREVQTGLKKDDWVVIRKGLKEGEKVVVGGQERLRDLTSVQSTEINRE